MEVQTKLIHKLIISLIPESNKKSDSDKYLPYFERLLNSRLNPITTNEAHVMSLMIDKASRIHLTNLSKLERLQTLYTSLGPKKILKRRWAVLYLLYRISQESSDNIAKESNSFLQMRVREDEISSETFHEFKIQTQEPAQKRPRQNTNVIVVNLNKTNKIITEKDLINDLIFVFQGIDGHYINYNSITNSYTLNSLIPFNSNIYDIVSTLSELGWLYRKVNNFVSFFKESNITSQIVQSFSFAIQSELNEYYKLISLFKKMNSNTEEISSNITGDPLVEELTLKKLLLWTLEPLERMKWLAIACESVYSKYFLTISFTWGSCHFSVVLVCEVLWC